LIDGFFVTGTDTDCGKTVVACGVVAALGARGLRVLAIEEGVSGLPDFLAARAPMAGGVAYVCRGTQCEPPIDALDALSARRPA
jgi:hypothetical protein